MDSDIMPCWKCIMPIGGEWFDGSEVTCEDCDAEGTAVYFTDGTWAHVPSYSAPRGMR